MAIDTFGVGAWGQTAAAADLGLSENGPVVSFQYLDELIDQTHLYQRTIVDMISQGGGCVCTTRPRARKASVARLLKKYDTALGKVHASGLLGTAYIFEYIATALTGSAMTIDFSTQAAIAGPATVTASAAILRENAEFSTPLTAVPQEHDIPLRFLPFTYNAALYWFRTAGNVA